METVGLSPDQDLILDKTILFINIYNHECSLLKRVASSRGLFVMTKWSWGFNPHWGDQFLGKVQQLQKIPLIKQIVYFLAETRQTLVTWGEMLARSIEKEIPLMQCFPKSGPQTSFGPRDFLFWSARIIKLTFLIKKICSEI